MNIYKTKVNIAQRVHDFLLFVLDTRERCKSLQFLLSDHNSACKQLSLTYLYVMNAAKLERKENSLV